MVTEWPKLRWWRRDKIDESKFKMYPVATLCQAMCQVWYLCLCGLIYNLCCRYYYPHFYE